MKATKQMKSSTTRETNAGTSTFKKNASVLQGSSPNNSKIKHKIKFLANDNEPLVFIPPASGESMVKYCIPIPSENKPDKVDELQMLKDITDHLNELVHTMEYVYAKKVEQNEEEEQEEEKEMEEEKEKESSVESVKDMTTFLLYFSSVATQLETACEEEKQILESLLKWFGKVVQQMEELGEDELVPDWQLPLADKDITNNITKLVQHFQKLEELKGRFQDLPKSIQIPAAAKQEKKKRASPVPSSHRDPKAILEDLVMKHGTEDVISMAHAFEDDLTPQTIETMSTRILDIMKVFERQTNKLQRISNEQDVLEGKYQKILNEYQLLSEEKQIMENELQKMKEEEKLGKEKIRPESRKRFLSKLERKQPVQNGEVSSLLGVQAAGEARRVSFIQSKKGSENQKMKDLIKAQENIQVLEQEKKNLEEKLQKAVEETGKGNRQFTKSVIPPGVQDMHVIYPEAEEEDAGTDVKINDKDLSKKSKLPTKFKGKEEDHTFSRQKSINGTDKSVSKLPAIDTGKQKGELLSRKTPVETEKNQEIMTSQLKDFKLEKKVLTDKENSKDYGVPENRLKGKVLVQERGQLYKAKDSAGVMEETPKLQFPQSEYESVQHTTLSTDKEPVPVKIKEESKGKKTQTEEKSETPLKLDSQGSTKRKKAAETKRGNSMKKSIGKETHSTTSSDLSQLHKVQEESPLDSSPDKSFSGARGQLISAKQEKISPENSQRKEAQATETLRSSIKDPAVFTDKNLTLPSTLIPKVQDSVKDLFPSHKETSADFAKIKEESQKTVIFPIEMKPATISSKILEEVSAGFTTEDKISTTTTSSVKEERFQVAQADIQGVPKDQETLILENILPDEKSLSRNYKEAVDFKERRLRELSEARKALLESLESNLEDLQQAQALASSQPSIMAESKVEELTKKREILLAKLEVNLKDLQEAQVSAMGQMEKEKLSERKLRELSEARKALLESLESNLKDLQQAQALASSQPSIMAESKVEELTKKREILLAKLEVNLKDLQEAQVSAMGQMGKEKLSERKLRELSEARKALLESLESNLKDLQQAQALASSQPSIMAESKVEELTKKREILLAKLEVNLKDLQEAQVSAMGQMGKEKLSEKERLQLPDFKKEASEPSHLQIPKSVSSLAGLQPTLGEVSERKLRELSEARKALLESLESNLKDLQQAQALASSQPSIMAESKVEELTKKREILLAKLEVNLKDLQQAQVSAMGQMGKEKLSERKLRELSEARKALLESLESNLKDLQQAQALASSQPSIMAESKVEELTKKREILLAKLEVNLKDLQQAQVSAMGQMGKEKLSERKLRELSEARKALLESLESNRKDLQQAQALASSQPSIMAESKVEKLTKKREILLAKLEVNLKDLQQAQVSAMGQMGKEKLSGSRMAHLEKKRVMPERPPVSNKIAQLDHTLSALLPQDEHSKNEMEQIALRKRLLLANLPSAFPYMSPPSNLPPLQIRLNNLPENEIQELLDKKRHHSTSQVFSLDYLSQAEALAQILVEQNIMGAEAQRLLATAIHQKKKKVKKFPISQNKDLNKGVLLIPQDTDKESLSISGKAYNVLSSRSSELKKDPKH
ncbi:uncharacterized protein CCDC7 isoform X3 [Pelodiscus sinensis]|uniref:uncharacterized protein CCDC7 isoform X3 n=1 Tax=Pelodiscus sinensis TaxID=13735 RepID=UPI003F6D00E1